MLLNTKRDSCIVAQFTLNIKIHKAARVKCMWSCRKSRLSLRTRSRTPELYNSLERSFKHSTDCVAFLNSLNDHLMIFLAMGNYYFTWLLRLIAHLLLTLTATQPHAPAKDQTLTAFWILRTCKSSVQVFAIYYDGVFGRAMRVIQMEAEPWHAGQNTSWITQEVPEEMELYVFTLLHSDLSVRRQDNSITQPCSTGPLSVCVCVCADTHKNKPPTERK